MRRFHAFLATVATLLLSGCMTTRLPQLPPRDPRVELKSFERHDPFPDPDQGPDLYVRPRGFENERPMPRRIYEERLLQGQQPENLPPASPFPSTGLRYSNVVQ